MCACCMLCVMWGWPIGGVVVLCYLSPSDGVSWSTSSHMWGSLYFARFLLRDGSLTLMYIASSIVLMTPVTSYALWWNTLKLTGCPVVLLWWFTGDGAQRCSFILSPYDLPDSPICSSRQLLCGQLNWYITPLSWHLLSLSCGAMSRVWIVLLSLKCTWMPKPLQIFLNLSLRPFV